MAIVRNESTPPNGDELDLIVNNGDLQVLKETVERLNFRDEENMIRFALAVLARSATRAITVTDQNGVKVTLNPSSELLKPTETKTEAAAGEK